VLGLLAIYLGGILGWRWVRHRRFRLVHLGAIGYVVVQAWLGAVCPLTTLEMALRAEAGSATYAGSFIQHWLQRLLYYTAPEWVFVAVYTLFGSLVLASWWVVRPVARQRG
jgi:polyferredoxin